MPGRSSLGEIGRGVPTILEMGTYTRLDCVIGSAGMMRHAVVQALHHARHRTRIRRPVDRSAPDARRARRSRRSNPKPRRRCPCAWRGHSKATLPAKATLRRALDLGRQILGVQARLRARGRGDGGARRQRLHRGAAAGAHRARNARQFHLGRLGQHHVPGRAAGVLQIARDLRGGAARAVDGARTSPQFRCRLRAVRVALLSSGCAAGVASTAFRPVVRHPDAGGAAARRRGGFGRGARRGGSVLRHASRSAMRAGGRCSARPMRYPTRASCWIAPPRIAHTAGHGRGACQRLEPQRPHRSGSSSARPLRANDRAPIPPSRPCRRARSAAARAPRWELRR